MIDQTIKETIFKDLDKNAKLVVYSRSIVDDGRGYEQALTWKVYEFLDDYFTLIKVTDNHAYFLPNYSDLDIDLIYRVTLKEKTYTRVRAVTLK